MGDEELMADLTDAELKAAFRYLTLPFIFIILFLHSRLFDENGEGFIRVATFRVRAQLNTFFSRFDISLPQKILKEVDESFTDEELDGIIGDVSENL